MTALLIILAAIGVLQLVGVWVIAFLIRDLLWDAMSIKSVAFEGLDSLRQWEHRRAQNLNRKGSR